MSSLLHQRPHFDSNYFANVPQSVAEKSTHTHRHAHTFKHLTITYKSIKLW